MGILSRVEAFLERFLEAPAGRLGASIQPVSLAKRIERAMDTNKTYGDVGRDRAEPATTCTSTRPTSRRSPSYRSSLEDDLAHGVLARARHERYTLVARPRVEILSDDGHAPRRDPRRRQRGRRAGRAGAARRCRCRPAPTPWSSTAPDAGDAPDSARRAYLLVSTRGSRPVQFDLGGPLIGVGRASDNDVIVDDPMVSRHHCQLKLQHGAYGFADLGSRNGSTVNGQPVSQIALGPGDVIRIGDTEIEFQVRG